MHGYNTEIYDTFIAVAECTEIARIYCLQIMQFNLKGGVIVLCIS